MIFFAKLRSAVRAVVEAGRAMRILSNNLEQLVVELRSPAPTKINEVLTELYSEQHLISDVIAALNSEQRLIKELVDGSNNQQRILNDKLIMIIRGLDNQSQVLEQRLVELTVVARDQQKLLTTKLDAVIRSLDLPHATGGTAGMESHVGGHKQYASAMQNARNGIEGSSADQKVQICGSVSGARQREHSLYVCHQAHEHDRIYAENVAEYMAMIDINCGLIEFESPGDRPELQKCIDEADVILGINSQLDHCWLGAQNFVDVAASRGLPVIHWIVDHPSARWMEFNNPMAPNARFLLVSKYCERYLRNHVWPGVRTSSTLGVGPNWRSRVVGITHRCFLEREIPCLVPFNLRRLSGFRHEIELEIRQMEPAIARAVWGAIERARSDLNGPLHEHLECVVAQEGLKLPDALFHQCTRIVEDITQVERRLKVLGTAARFPVRIQTDEPPPYLTEGAVASFYTDGQSTSPQATMAIMQSCRSVLSVSLTNDMLHDRVANAINAGCIAIIEDNAIHRELFHDRINALFFRYDDDSLAQCLDLVCNRLPHAYDIARSGFCMRDDPRIRFGNFQEILGLAFD